MNPALQTPDMVTCGDVSASNAEADRRAGGEQSTPLLVTGGRPDALERSATSEGTYGGARSAAAGSKDTNPKDAIGQTKLPLDLVPDTAIAYMALAFLEGALKYGRYNWRIAGVRWSIYQSAFERHRMKVTAGEWADPKTGVPHLASMMACLAIILDAHTCGKLIDDRPPSCLGVSSLIDGMAGDVARLKEVFKDFSPHQYTIEDTPDA